MSKISELLNYNNKERRDKKGEGENFSNPAPSKNFDSDTKEKLAKTYIFNPVDKSGNSNKKHNEKILPHKYGVETSKIRFAQFFPWLISFLAVLLLLANIAYRGKINVKIEILKEGSIQPTPSVSKNLPTKKGLASETKSVKITPISIVLVAEWRLNRRIIKKLGFYGAALSKSTMTQDGLFLFNDGTTGWASVGLDLAKPMDLSDNAFDFFIKGIHGNESLKLILRDAENSSYMPQAYNIIFNKNMAKDWQFVSIPFNNFNGTYNPKRITHIGFEFGTQTTSNEPGVSIHIKNMKIVKNPASPLYEKTIRRGE